MAVSVWDTVPQFGTLGPFFPQGLILGASPSPYRGRVPAVRTSGLMVLEVDGRKVPAMSKKSETRPSEPRQPLVPTGRTTAWGPSGAQSGVQQGLQAQDWVSTAEGRGVTRVW